MYSGRLMNSRDEPYFSGEVCQGKYDEQKS